MTPFRRDLWRRLTRPLPAAGVVCAAGLACAVFAVGVNRIAAARGPVPLAIVAPTPGPTAAPSPTATPAATAAAASCEGAPSAKKDLAGLVLAAPAQVSITDGTTTVAVLLPAGAVLDGHTTDVHATAAVSGPGQPLHGTLVDSITLCAQAGSRQVGVALTSGAQVDGTAVPTADGIEAHDIHVQAATD